MKTNAQEFVRPLSGPNRPAPVTANSIGAILVEEGKLSLNDTDRVMELQHREGWRFGEAALRLGLINEDELDNALARQYDLPLLTGNDSASWELVTAYKPFHPRAEELRSLRAQLQVRWFKPGSRQRVLSIVSPGSGEGRSYVAANLAVLFSQLGERTLLIDADLRNPRQHRIFNVPDRVGLSAVLSGRADRSAAVAVPGFHRLTLLPAGAQPPNPLELLSRPALGGLLADAQPDFDVILVDTSPAAHYADAQAVTFSAGSALVLTRRNHTRLSDTGRVVQQLSDTGATVVGTVINSF